MLALIEAGHSSPDNSGHFLLTKVLQSAEPHRITHGKRKIWTNELPDMESQNTGLSNGHTCIAVGTGVSGCFSFSAVLAVHCN